MLPDSLGSPSVSGLFPQRGWSWSLQKRQHQCSCRTWGHSQTHACQFGCSTRTQHHPPHMTPAGCRLDSIQCHVSALRVCELLLFWEKGSCLKIKHTCFAHLSIVALQINNILKREDQVNVNDVSVDSSEHVATVAEGALRCGERERMKQKLMALKWILWLTQSKTCSSPPCSRAQWTPWRCGCHRWAGSSASVCLKSPPGWRGLWGAKLHCAPPPGTPYTAPTLCRQFTVRGNKQHNALYFAFIAIWLLFVWKTLKNKLS